MRTLPASENRTKRAARQKASLDWLPGYEGDDVQRYRDAHGVYLVAGPTPPEVPQGYAVPWPEDERFHALGFEPGPRVRYQYEVVVVADPVGEPEVSCYARGDLDGDGQNSVFRVTLDVHGLSSPVQAEREQE